MKIVLDESVPRRIVQMLRDHGLEASPFPSEWKGLKNGALLRRVEAGGFSCFVTCDRNLRHQQTIPGRPFGVVVLPRQRFGDLLPFAARIAAAAGAVMPGETIVVEG